MPNLFNAGYMTELSAVNYVLRAMGTAQLPAGTDLSTVTQADVVNIIGHFIDITSEVLAMGEWKWNTEIGYQLQPAGQINWNNPATGDVEVLNVFAIPSNMAAYRATPNYAQTGTNYVDLGFRQATIFNQSAVYPLVFYDRDNNREGWNAAAYPFLQLDVAWFGTFVNLPYQAQLYIAARTARRSVEQGINSSEIAGFIKTDEAWAYRHLKRLLGINDNYNALRTVYAYRVYGNRPATNVGFIDIRGLAPAMTATVVAQSPITVSPATASVSHVRNATYTVTFTLTNPNDMAVAATLAVTVDATKVLSGSSEYATCEIPANSPASTSLPVIVTYTLENSAFSGGTVTLTVTTKTIGDATTIGSPTTGVLTVAGT